MQSINKVLSQALDATPRTRELTWQPWLCEPLDMSVLIKPLAEGICVTWSCFPGSPAPLSWSEAEADWVSACLGNGEELSPGKCPMALVLWLDLEKLQWKMSVCSCLNTVVWLLLWGWGAGVTQLPDFSQVLNRETLLASRNLQLKGVQWREYWELFWCARAKPPHKEHN